MEIIRFFAIITWLLCGSTAVNFYYLTNKKVNKIVNEGPKLLLFRIMIMFGLIFIGGSISLIILIKKFINDKEGYNY